MATIRSAGSRMGDAARSGTPPGRKARRRYLTPQAGRALEILGHAIEYLADELVHEGRQVDAHDPQVEAIQKLMALNRQVYYECPLVPTFMERLRALFHLAPPAGIR